MSLKLEKHIFITINMTIIASRVDDDTRSSWQTPSSYGRYGATLSATKHTTIY
jgi:hypothetical protein